MNPGTKIPFARRTADNLIVAVEDVERGLACGCVCPSCNGRLVARKGPDNIHHFGHYDKSSELCKYAFETSIRLMLLSRLNDIHALSLPTLKWPYSGTMYDLIPAHDVQQLNLIEHNAQGLSPAGVYQRPNETLSYGLYFPPAGQHGDIAPMWMDEYISRHPNTAILSIRYLQFAALMYGSKRQDNMDSTTLLVELLQTHAICLGWLYHPQTKSRQDSLIKQYEEYMKAKAEHQARKQHNLMLWEKRVRTVSNSSHSRPAVASVRYVDEYIPTPPICKLCNKRSSNISRDGICARPSCQQQYAEWLKEQEKKELEEIADYIGTSPKALEQPTDDGSVYICPRCETDMYSMGNTWWCESCGFLTDKK